METAKGKDTITILAVGDISLISNKSSHPFKKIIPILKKKDILFGNLETALSDSSYRSEKAVALVSSASNVKYLKDADFDVLNIANNHILDAHDQGLRETIKTLNENKLNHIGVKCNRSHETSIILQRNGISIGFAGYDNYGYVNNERGIQINKINQAAIIEDIRKLRRSCDFVVISLHWGIENIFLPSPDQTKLARTLIDNGATIILGHHSHTVQGIERYNNGLIVYSLGNFQFPPGFNHEPLKNRTRNSKSIIVKLIIGKKGLQSYSLIPIHIDNDFFPEKCNDEEGCRLLDFISKIGAMIENNQVNNSMWFEHIAHEYLTSNGRAFLLRIKKYGVKHLWWFLKWLISPFVLKCYTGLIRSKLRLKQRVMINT
ncbi:MAG: CapA family protein [candidate division Zixibacteria bacterium]|nr:CapA family protein [candidate division Zixibacteria bacterium]